MQRTAWVDESKGGTSVSTIQESASAQPTVVPMAPPRKPSPVLLAMADYYGTLAATRCFGAYGVPVTMAESRLLAPARWSRHVRRQVRCPKVSSGEQFIDWLLAFGRREPGHVLCPTSDDLAWLYSLHREELGRYYQMYQPSMNIVRALLDKKALFLACRKVGLGAPETYFPVDDQEVESIAQRARFPLLIKPRMQVMSQTRIKGELVLRRDQLQQRYREFLHRNSYEQALLRRWPDVARPMLQTYYPEAKNQVHSLAGFLDETGRLLATRAARKLLQRPPQAGVGICFEEAQIDEGVAEKVMDLLRQSGYHGVFEVELIRSGTEYLVIDINPRFYGQMWFDIARGLPLPMLMYYAARRDHRELRQAISHAQSQSASGSSMFFCHRFALQVLLSMQRASGRMSRQEAQSWRQRYRGQADGVFDAVADPGDRMPWIIAVLDELARYARHPRSFFRTIVLGRDR